MNVGRGNKPGESTMTLDTIARPAPGRLRMRNHFPEGNRGPGRLGGFGLTLLVACLASFVLLGADWPQFFGPGRNGVSSETGLSSTWPTNGPPLAWQRPVRSRFSGPV